MPLARFLSGFKLNHILYGIRTGRSGGVDLRLEHADIREIAVFFCVIEPIADDERVRHLKAGIGGVDRRLAAGGLIEQGGNGDGGRPADAEIVLEIVQRDAAVENVLNEDDVTALDVLSQVLVTAPVVVVWLP